MSNPDVRTVYVDDSDPNIQYSDGWSLVQGIPTAPSAVRVSATAMYGTVHSTTALGSSDTSANLTYTFDGIEFSAQFASSSVDAIISCTVDGADQNIEPGLNGAVCSGRNLEPGPHQLMIQVQQHGIEPVVFDNLSFSTTRTAAQDLDFIYTIDDPEVQVTFDQFMRDTGDKLDITFSGYSIGAYAEFHVTPNEIPTTLFYTIDDGPPINFTLTSPAIMDLPEVVPQLIFQSPRLTLGNHHLHLQYLGSEAQNSTKIDLMYVQVQNSQLPITLDAVPPIISSSSSASPSLPSPSSTSFLSLTSLPSSSPLTTFSSSSWLATSTHPLTPSFAPVPTHFSHQTIAIHTIIIASVVSSFFVILIFSLALFLFIRRRRHTLLSQILCCESPPISEDPQRGSRRRLSKGESQSVASLPRNDLDVRENVVYRHHQDSGATLTDYTDVIQRVVDVPPTYSVIGMPRPTRQRKLSGPLAYATADPADIPPVPTINPKLVHLTWTRAPQSHERI